MKKTNKGFTLIELLAVIVVLAIVSVLAVTTVLPYMTSAREQSFRIEASNAVSAAESAVKLYNLNDITVDESHKERSCSGTTKMCFTVGELIRLGLYQADGDLFKGKVVINGVDTKSPSYTLYFKKGDEFKFANQNFKNYKDNGVLSTSDWASENETCVSDCD